LLYSHQNWKKKKKKKKKKKFRDAGSATAPFLYGLGFANQGAASCPISYWARKYEITGWERSWL